MNLTQALRKDLVLIGIGLLALFSVTTLCVLV